MRPRAIVLFVALLLAAEPARSTTVTGTMKDIQGNLLSGTGDYATFQLMNFGSNVPRVTGTNIVVQTQPLRVTSAQLVIGVTIQANDTITPATTFYRVTFFHSGQLFRSFDHRITGASYNLDSATPITTNPVVAAPTGDTTYLRVDGGNVNLAGNLNLVTDYKASAGTGLTLNLAAGTAFCGNPPVKVDYAGGTLTMTNAATNYIYLDPGASCVPAKNTTGLTAGMIPVAQVVAAGGVITGVTDVRTWFVDLASTGAERTVNKNAASGYAGLTAGTKLNAAQGQEVWSAADLSDLAGLFGTVAGTKAVTTALTGDPTTDNCVKWIAGGKLGDTGAACGSGGSGDNISVNGTAATDADFDDATPAAPSNAINVKWQKDTGTPNNLSAHVPYAAPLTVTGGNLTVTAGLKTRQLGFMVGADTGAALADTDDQTDLYVNRLGQGITISEVWCACDAGSPIIQLQKDDGTPTNMLTANLTCSAGAGASTTSFVSGENAMADGTRLDFVMVTAGGTAKRVTVFAKYTLD